MQSAPTVETSIVRRSVMHANRAVPTVRPGTVKRSKASTSLVSAPSPPVRSGQWDTTIVDPDSTSERTTTSPEEPVTTTRVTVTPSG